MKIKNNYVFVDFIHVSDIYKLKKHKNQFIFNLNVVFH